MTYLKTNIKEFIKESNTDKLTWEQSTHTIEIPNFKLNDYKKLLRKLNRFSKTIGFPLPVSKETTTKKMYLVYDGGSIIENTYDLERAKKFVTVWEDRSMSEVTVHVFDLTIVDDVKPIEEWEILGTIDYIDSIVKSAPNKEVPMELLGGMSLSGNSDCDHCGKKIYRNKTVFVKNTKDGEIKHVGGTCTKYYLGMDYKRVLDYIESIHVMVSPFEFNDEWGSYGKPIEKQYHISDILKYYIWHTKHNGHMSKKQAEAYNDKIDGDSSSHRKESTGNMVSTMVEFVSYPPELEGMNSYEKSHAVAEWEKDTIKFEKNIKTIKDGEVQEILDFIESKKEENNFMFNVSNKIGEGSVIGRLISYITGACSFFFSIKLYEENQRKKKEKQLKDSEDSPSTHIGTIGEKYGFEAKITRLSGFEGSFGWTNIYTMEDDKGNVITKFGKINNRFITNGDEDIEVGTALAFTADVKDHGEFNGINQTTIGRLSKFNAKLTY
jgi:large-conductance mechanosensitive channel